MTGLDDLMDKMSNKVKFILLMVAFFSMVATAYGTLAKQSDMNEVVAWQQKKDLKERIDFLEGQIDKCKDKYGDDFSGATDPWDKGNCRKWFQELKDKYKEYDQFFKS